MDLLELKNIITTLIDSHREDDYWDFKQSYPENKANLLHDIICMANNRSDKNGFIIFGVQDNTYEIIGVEHDSNRKNQQNVIDFLKSKPFSMGIRPKIQLITLTLEIHEIDVLIIYNATETPYYLTEDYKFQGRIVKANYIYTRVGDTNTDIDKSADGNHVEYLWKKRFGMHLPPYEKLKFNLGQKENWIVSDNTYYHNINPEFTLTEIDDPDSKSAEFYAYAMDNCAVSYGMLHAKYFGTTLYSRQTVTLDSGRYTTVVPDWGFIHHDKYARKTDAFKYYIKTDILYDFHTFLLDESSHEAVYAYSEFMNVVMIFDSNREKDCFIEYVESNLKIFEEKLFTNDSNYDYLEISEPEKELVVRRLKVAETLKKMQIEFHEKERYLNEDL